MEVTQKTAHTHSGFVRRSIRGLKNAQHMETFFSLGAARSHGSDNKGSRLSGGSSRTINLRRISQSRNMPPATEWRQDEGLRRVHIRVLGSVLEGIYVLRIGFTPEERAKIPSVASERHSSKIQPNSYCQHLLNPDDHMKPRRCCLVLTLRRVGALRVVDTRNVIPSPPDPNVYQHAPSSENDLGGKRR